MEWLRRDLRVGVRRLAREKGFTLTAALTLALCLGANTAIFSVVHNVLLRALPYGPQQPSVRLRPLLGAHQALIASGGSTSGSNSCDPCTECGQSEPEFKYFGG